MRFTFLATAALAGAAALVVPAVAADPDIFIGGAVGPLERYETKFQAWAGMAGIQYSFTPNLGMQGDFVVHQADYPAILELNIGDFDGAAHLFHRNENNFLIGGFVQGGTTRFSSKGGPREFHRLIAGVEGQIYFDQLTLYGQAGVIRQTYPSLMEYSALGYFATGEARYFITPEFKVEAHAGISVMHSDSAMPTIDANNINLGFGAEYRFEDSPLSVFGTFDTFQHTSSYSDRSTRVMVGLKGNFGTDTLLQRDRGGITLKPIDGHFAASPSPD